MALRMGEFVAQTWFLTIGSHLAASRIYHLGANLHGGIKVGYAAGWGPGGLEQLAGAVMSHRIMSHQQFSSARGSARGLGDVLC